MPNFIEIHRDKVTLGEGFHFDSLKKDSRNGLDQLLFYM